MSNPVIVNVLTSEIKTFKDVKEITIGRNTASSIDIPSPVISRTQCVLILNENNEWFLTDLSRHRSTLLNNISLQGRSHILRSGDKISFLNYRNGEYTFYYSISEVPNPSKKRKLDSPADFNADVLTPNPAEVKNNEHCQSLSQSNAIEELNRELALLKEKYDLALEEIDNQRKVNETVSLKLNSLMTETSDKVSSLQKETEILSKKLKEEESVKEKMINEIQELNELLKESELEQIRLNEECKCKELCLDKSIKQDDEPEAKEVKEETDPEENVTTAEALQKLVEIVEIKWNEQEMEHMREQLKMRDEKITDLALESEKFQSQVIETIDREMLCSICNDIIYEATTLNCRHTFCRFCLFEWKKKKKECPVCRTKIKTETRPLVIDSFIDKLSDTIGGELKTRRMEVKEERTSKPTRGGSSSSSRASPYSRNGRNNRRTRGNFNTISSAMSILQPSLVIELTDHFVPGMVPGPVIDLTAGSPVTPRQRRRRQPAPTSYYDLV